jgi:hypothetical protein
VKVSLHSARLIFSVFWNSAFQAQWANSCGCLAVSLAHLLEGVLADRGRERSEHAGPVPGQRLAGAERAAEEGERRVLAVFAPPVPVLAVHDLAGLCAVSVTKPPVALAGAMITKNPCRQRYTELT